MQEIEVKTIKGFNGGAGYIKRGSTITVDEVRAGDLHRNGLIEDYELKQAPEPENKQAPTPANKGGKPASKPKE